MSHLLKVENLSKRFGGLVAVKDISFEVETGQIYAIIGPNGAGKTTLFNMLTGLIPATSGSASFQGQELCSLPPHRITQIGLCRTFQNICLFGNMTVLDNVIVGLHSRTNTNLFEAIFQFTSSHREWQRMAGEALELLDTFDLLAYKDEFANNLPYGQQRWLEIARALASQPKLLLLDEPVAGLNISETEIMMRQISWLRKDLGKTILLIEHDMKFVMGISDHLIVLDHGQMIAKGDPNQIQGNDMVIEAYLGKGYKKHVRSE